MGVSSTVFADPVAISVDDSAEKIPISSALFGRNNSGAESLTEADWQRLRDAGVRMLRENGGNNATKYNWRLQLSSHPDWYNNVYGGDGGWDKRVSLIQQNLPRANTMWAFQLIGKAAATNEFNFNDWEFNQSQWWSGVNQNLAGAGMPNLDGGGDALVEGDPNLYLMDWPAEQTVGILDHWFNADGLGINKARARYWSIDNEPNVWDGVHQHTCSAVTAKNTV